MLHKTKHHTFLKYKYDFLKVGKRAQNLVQNFHILSGLYDPQKVHYSRG